MLRPFDNWIPPQAAGLEPLKVMLERMGGWPLLEGASWSAEGYKWYDMTYKFRDHGYSVDYLVDFSVTTDLKNSRWASTGFGDSLAQLANPGPGPAGPGDGQGVPHEGPPGP